ncbi:MAG TPA: hypothetical protein VGN01_00065 [Acidobacteriaceae bacterium]|jgi:hypothetical protein
MIPSAKCFVAVTLLFMGLPYARVQEAKYTGPGPDEISTNLLIRDPGPSFQVEQRSLVSPEKVIVYGDQRFTDPTNTKVTNPVARRLLVQKIAQERPDAILMSGDIPYSGDVSNDYVVYKSETQIWSSVNYSRNNRI